ncbi:MAG: alpha/beta fold hydrolase [Dermatophilaceae bacterium]
MDRYTRAGLEFLVRDDGPRGGTPVVLLHGFPQDASCWQQVTPLLGAAGLRTLAPDQRGYSPGARPRGRAAYAVAELVGDVVALLDAAGLAQAHVVGHDWGGGVAWMLATYRPERVASLTVLSTPHPTALRWAFTNSTQWQRSWYMFAFQLPVVPELVMSRQLGTILRASGLDATDATRYADRFASAQSLYGPVGWYRAAPPTAGLLKALRAAVPGARPASADGATPGRQVARVGVPTTYVWGNKDPVLGRAAAERTGRYVAADYRFVEIDAGHWLPETAPAEVAAAVIERVTGR